MEAEAKQIAQHFVEKQARSSVVHVVDGANLTYNWMQFFEKKGVPGDVLIVIKHKARGYLKSRHLDSIKQLIRPGGGITELILNVPRCRGQKSPCFKTVDSKDKTGLRTCTWCENGHCEDPTHEFCEYDDFFMTLLVRALKNEGLKARIVSTDKRVYKKLNSPSWRTMRHMPVRSRGTH